MAVLDSTKLLEIFICSDDCCKEFQKKQLSSVDNILILSDKEGCLSTFEMMRIIIFYHHSDICCFRWYYQQILQRHFVQNFSDL